MYICCKLCCKLLFSRFRDCVYCHLFLFVCCTAFLWAERNGCSRLPGDYLYKSNHHEVISRFPIKVFKTHQNPLFQDTMYQVTFIGVLATDAFEFRVFSVFYPSHKQDSSQHAWVLFVIEDNSVIKNCQILSTGYFAARYAG